MMKNINKVFIAIIFALLSVAALAAPSKNVIQNTVSAAVDYVYDGDTFGAKVLLADGIEISVRVRIMQIDAPEIQGECDFEIDAAAAAKNRLAELLPAGSRVTLTGVKDDKYLGRIDAFVQNAKGADVGEILVNEGLVRRYNGGKRAGWCGG